MDTKNADLLEKANIINMNINSKGMKRYDPSDIRKLNVISQNNIMSKSMRKALLFTENFFPLLLRKILKLPKTYFPTAFTHVAEAYLLAEKYNIDLLKEISSVEIMDEAINIYLENIEGEYYWKFKENHQFVDDKKMNNRQPTMPMHGLARLNIILLKLGKYYKKYEFIDIAYKSAIYVIKNHQMTNYGDGTMSISYFYNSNDCTINVNTEFAQWLSMIPFSLRNDEMNEVINGIVKLVIKEQNDDGSWYYFSKQHMIKWGDKPSIDCHHTGTIISNLIYTLNYYPFEGNLKNELIRAINRGMKFYVDNFFNLNLGTAKTLIGYKRPAGPIQYSEAIFAFCNYLASEQLVNLRLKSQIKELLPKVMSVAVSLINCKDGSVPSEKVVKWVNIDSIRWGNGPILQAIMQYLSIQDFIDQNY